MENLSLYLLFKKKRGSNSFLILRKTEGEEKKEKQDIISKMLSRNTFEWPYNARLVIRVQHEWQVVLNVFFSLEETRRVNRNENMSFRDWETVLKESVTFLFFFEMKMFRLFFFWALSSISFRRKYTFIWKA